MNRSIARPSNNDFSKIAPRVITTITAIVVATDVRRQWTHAMPDEHVRQFADKYAAGRFRRWRRTQKQVRSLCSRYWWAIRWPTLERLFMSQRANEHAVALVKKEKRECEFAVATFIRAQADHHGYRYCRVMMKNIIGRSGRRPRRSRVRSSRRVRVVARAAAKTTGDPDGPEGPGRPAALCTAGNSRHHLLGGAA